MKLRKHKDNRTYKINWTERTPRVVETHVGRGGKTERVVTGGDFKPKLAVLVTGQNPTATLNAFLFGRDRTNILADIRQHYPEFCWRGCDTRVKATCVLGIVQPNLPTV